MIASHVEAPAQFDRTKVDVRMPQAFEDMLARRDYLGAAYSCGAHNFNNPLLNACRLGDRLSSTLRWLPIREAQLHFSSPILG
jgi:hypothetical protein